MVHIFHLSLPYHAFDAVLHEADVPIEEESELPFRELEVCQELGLMDREHIVDSFVFDDNAVVDEHVDAKAGIDDYLVVRDGERDFTGDFASQLF